MRDGPSYIQSLADVLSFPSCPVVGTFRRGASMLRLYCFIRATLVALLLCVPCLLHAQPSGGPYGPIQQTYEVPKEAKHVYYVAPDGRPEATGRSVNEPTTIEAAIERVVTGDAIILRGGVYRTGDLKLNQGVTIQPYRDERPILKGTQVATEWEALQGGLWRTRWTPLFPAKPDDWWRREREAARTPLYLFNNDMVFVDGQMLQAVGWAGEVDEESYWIDYDKGYVYIGVNPTDKLVEITAFDNGLIRTIGDVHGKQSDRKGPVIRGLTFTQYAYRAIEIEGHDPQGVAPESQFGKDVVGTTIEHCTISHCSRAAGYFRGDHMTIRHCLVSDTSTEGIYLLASNDVLLEKNVITRNNSEGITGYYGSAVKIFNQCHRVTCRDNLVTDNPPDSSGIWYDVGEVDGVFVDNWVQRTDNGIFLEISKGATIAGNVLVDCNTGIFILNSRDAHIYQNTLYNSAAVFERTARGAVADHFGWHPSTGPGVDERQGHVFVGNLLAADTDFKRPLLQFRQRDVLRERLTTPQVAELDYNVYVRRAGQRSAPLIVWSPSSGGSNSMALHSPGELHALYPKFAGHSRAYQGYYGPLFKSERLSRFELLPGFPGADSAAPLPDHVLALLGWTAATFPGAFPVAR